MPGQSKYLGIASAVVVPGLFAVTSFSGALLLFLMEPFFGKSLLPLYGGTPAVWNTCVFFFQFMLLVGYVYVYVICRYLSIPMQVLAYVATIVAAAATLPLRLSTMPVAYLSEQPIVSLVQILSLSAGLPFLALSTTSPLVQAWYARVRTHESPYWLYVASNAGSLAALIAYPFFLEDWLPLSKQSQYWSYSFLGFASLSLACGLCAGFWRGKLAVPPQASSAGRSSDLPSPVVTHRMRVNWLLWSMCPSSLMLGVTIYLSSEIAPIPVLWVLPLAVYLLSLMIAFANPPLWFARLNDIGYFVFAIIVAVSANLLHRAPVWDLIFHISLLFVGTTALHSQLARHRPGPAHLAEYYLWISIGGLCGGIFNSLLAPVLFNWLAEYPCAIVCGLLLIPWPFPAFQSNWRFQGAIRAGVAALMFLGLSWNVYFSESSHYVMYRERTFFGPFSITQGKRGVTHQLVHGTTNHGTQNVKAPTRERRPALTYYFWSGPVGEIFIAYRRTELTQSVGIVGLGIGSLASYGDPGQKYTFYEIDPAIERIARNPRWFTFLDDAEARGVKLQVEIGDARLRLVDAPDQEFGILVLDAFTSDAIPIHLLTKEAVSLYLSKLKSNGVLAFHISNLFIDLEPILSNIAAELGQVAFIRVDDKVTNEEMRLGKNPSIWLVMAPSVEVLEPLLTSGQWRPCKPKSAAGVWTDDRSNLLRAIRW